MTFLVASHLASEIEKMCDKVLVLYEGESSPSTPRRRPCACTPPWKITSWRRCGTKRAPWCCKKGEILMQAFAASLQNELFKLRKRKKYLVLLIIASAICVVSALRVLIVNYLTDGGVSREAILGGLMSSNMPFVLLIFLPLMAIMAAGGPVRGGAGGPHHSLLPHAARGKGQALFLQSGGGLGAVRL